MTHLICIWYFFSFCWGGWGLNHSATLPLPLAIYLRLVMSLCLTDLTRSVAQVRHIKSTDISHELLQQSLSTAWLPIWTTETKYRCIARVAAPITIVLQGSPYGRQLGRRMLEAAFVSPSPGTGKAPGSSNGSLTKTGVHGGI